MTDTERKEAIKEVLNKVKKGKQHLQNGADEIETINYLYRQEQVNVALGNVRLSFSDSDIADFVETTVFLNSQNLTGRETEEELYKQGALDATTDLIEKINKA